MFEVFISFYLCLDYAYVDSQQPELPYHICVIRDFKLVRDTQIAISFCTSLLITTSSVNLCSFLTAMSVPVK